MKLRDSVALISDARSIERAAQTADRSPASALRRAILLTRLGMVTGDRVPLDEALRDLAGVIETSPQLSADAWYGLGVTKLELNDAGYTAKEGPYQRVGTDYLEGAVAGLIRAINADPSYDAAAELLATTVLRQTVKPAYAEALHALRTSATRVRESPGRALARALLERETGNTDSAFAALSLFLSIGGDSGVAFIEQARTLFYGSRPAEGLRAYYLGAQYLSSPQARAQYRTDLAWVASDEELAEFDSTSAPVQWLERFWSTRDARDGRLTGERLTEHYRRLRYVRLNFRRTLAPHQHDGTQLGNSPGARLRSQTGQRIVRSDGTETDESIGKREIGRSAADLMGGLLGSHPSEMAPGEVYARLHDQTVLRAFHSGQSMVDDRGLIYVRHGAPQERASYVGPEADANESWKYYTPEGELVFHFVGTIAPTTLVEQLPLFGPLLASRGSLNPIYDQMAAELASPRSLKLKPEEIMADRARNREAITVGMHTDDFVLGFDHQLSATVQAFGVRSGVEGTGQILLVFAISASGLTPIRVTSDSLVAYPVHLRAVAEAHRTHRLVELDTTRVFVTRRVLGSREVITGQARIPVLAGSYIVRVILSDHNQTAGVASGFDSIPVPEFNDRTLSMSDLVLGRWGSGQEWLAGADTVALNPLNSFPPNSDAEVYYQVGGLVPGQVYRTRIDIREGLGGSGKHTQVKFEEKAARSRQAMVRTLGLRSLTPGKYTIAVTIDGPAGAHMERKQFIVITGRQADH